MVHSSTHPRDRGTVSPGILKKVPLCAGLFLILTVASPAQEELPLPTWTEEELRSFREQENLMPPVLETLLPEAPGYMENLESVLREPLKSGPRLDELPAKLSGEIMPRLRVEHMLSFLPETVADEEVRSAVPVPQEPASPVLREVSPEFLKAAAEAPGGEFLIDPDTHVPEMAGMELSRLLQFHARDARIALHVLILGKNQSLPPNAKLDAVASGKLATSDACLLVYPLGEPWRARLFVSQSVHEHTSGMFLSETIRECVKQSLLTTEVQDQLERYVVALSTRLFWLQKALDKDLRRPRTASSLKEFAESASSVSNASVEKAPTTVFAASVTSWVVWTLAGLLASAGGAWATIRMRLKWQVRRQNSVWILPEPEVTPRLGGTFTGGGGIMVRYA